MNMQNAKNAMVELQIIQLELANNRDYHFRHTVDQWFAYANGYVTSSGKEATSKIEGREWVSEGWLAAEDKSSKNVVKKEHVMPLKVLRDELMEMDDQSLISIEAYLKENVIFATITKEEDARLNAMDCKKAMPPEYYDETSPLYKNKWARYIKAGIKVSKMS